MTYRSVTMGFVLATLMFGGAAAESAPLKDTLSAPQTGAACGALMGGSADVAVEGRQAGTVGALGCLKPLEGSSNVSVNGRPVLRVGDRVQCPDGRVGVIADGASSVIVNGRPAATAASRVIGCE